MMQVLRSWFHRYFSDEEAVVLFIVLALGLAFVVIWGDIMAPVIAAGILAFILQGLVFSLSARGVNEKAAIYVAFTFFIAVVTTFFLVLLPLVWTQLSSLINDAPQIMKTLQAHIVLTHEKYPGLIKLDDIDKLYDQASAEIADFVQWIAGLSLKSLPFLITFLIYMIVVPILVFFFLKDKDHLFAGVAKILPTNRRLMTDVWEEMNLQFANYIRGKTVEIVIVGGVSYIAFVILGLNYAALLGFLVGLSVVIPYIGAVIVTIPVTMIALFQFGLQDQFYYVMIAYFVIQILDGNVLVPLLFSEVVNLHPVVIIVAVLFFGGIWGIWGVFFAIPLATLVKAVFAAWPVHLEVDEDPAQAIVKE